MSIKLSSNNNQFSLKYYKEANLLFLWSRDFEIILVDALTFEIKYQQMI
jgi:hypothetical protein